MRPDCDQTVAFAGQTRQRHGGGVVVNGFAPSPAPCSCGLPRRIADAVVNRIPVWVQPTGEALINRVPLSGFVMPNSDGQLCTSGTETAQ